MYSRSRSARQHLASGSRLLDSPVPLQEWDEDGRFIGYAEWPDQATWQKAFDVKIVYDDPEARAMFVAALEEDSRPGELIAAMEMLDDFLTLWSGPRA